MSIETMFGRKGVAYVGNMGTCVLKVGMVGVVDMFKSLVAFIQVKQHGRRPLCWTNVRLV